MNKLIVFLVILGAAFTAGFVRLETFETVHIGKFNEFLPQIDIFDKELLPTSVSFVGDVMLARNVETYLDWHGSSYVYSDLPGLSTSTLLVGNFEATIPEEHTQTPDNTFSFSVDTQHISALREYGFKYMSLANNHSYDKGVENFIHTQKILAEEGVHSFGSPSEVGTTSVVYIDLEDSTVALIGLYGLGEGLSDEMLRGVLNISSEGSDFQVVYIHWGSEYESTHSKVQEKLAHKLVDAGADAIIGHHPHVVQDVELYDGSVIFYSLGNFIFDQYFNQSVQEGLWITVSVTEGKLSYVLQGVTSIGSKSVPRFMAAQENTQFLKEMAKSSSVDLQEMIREGVIK